MLAAGFAFLFAAAVAVGYLAYRTTEADQWVAHTLNVQKIARELLGQIQEAETGQRSFLLTGDGSYLEPYTVALVTAPTTLRNLRALTSDNHEQQDRLTQLTPLTERRLQVVKRTVDLALAGRRDEAIEIVKNAEGKSLMGAIRVILNDFIDAESLLLTQRSDRSAALRATLFSLIGLCLLIVCILAAMVARSTRRYVKSLRGEAKQREAVEGSLRQAQKMEAVGQLTGGIAHDFNNLLTIILGNLEIAGRRLAKAGPEMRAFAAAIETHIGHAVEGGRRAAQLTHRLLAFSRQQPLEPKVTDLNRLVAGIGELLRRSVGEAIEIETVTAGGLWRTFVDANQLENVILNLVLNARDAMPGGGRVTIETGNTYLDEAYAARHSDVSAGQYALLSVADTGAGIPPAIIEKVFEPFFTTKTDGKGSGLGLAMVHGFVKQSGGHVRIYSERGEGTTVKIYLPRSTEALSEETTGRWDTQALPCASGGEKILVVEDDEGVRNYAAAVLAELGYEVVTASDAEQALGRLEGVDLMFTDVVLPGGTNGRALAEKVLAVKPELPVLFTTGYTRNAIVHHGRLDPDVFLLTKPYTEQDLARKVREILDRARGVNIVAMRR